MKRGKKVNTLGLIQKMAEQNKETVNVLKTLKSERSIEETPSGSKQHFEPKTVRNTKETAVIENHKGMTSKNSSMTDEYPVRQFKLFLRTENFRDRKESFVLSLSKDCMGKYEKLAQGASYKLDIKTHRNDLIRKVLEDFIDKKYRKLINIIEQK
ncbi:hypothetical protein MTsPCn5_08910 [Croceitalea sp. MTPC5]|jgi:hypothetical protein|uniref:DUF3408 domain-containing protein n=4 Tax=Flagellimonas TaxID=444459 RepID=A0A371JVI6_9FLAO|nr:MULTISPECIES: hypothetical protein [Allomuricauda]GMN05503.1 hypothetical protein MTsPCn5_08910 [Croceitalea sp. MTPC5]MBO0340726.1 hypothetical protein [Allomuricauda profundi]MBO6589685.1 hypothetical protein [Allomuricauda sp.]MBO6619382.1 hypothetical protein [Allomuricauda sp.]MBO6645293.1 hypothetical protein [Allomuricauda sp.]|tara:strand:+ start:28068 stop:28532 length:465 start_codon:yes stop_codon:yes gene_type:complete